MFEIMENFLRKHFETIISLADEEFAYIEQHFTTKRLRKHQFLVQAGEPVNNIFLTVKGCLKSYYLDDDGKEHILLFAMEGWWISDFQAYADKTNAKVFVDCLEDSEFFVLSRENQIKICAELHKIEHFFRIRSNMAYLTAEQRILSLINNKAEDRYEQFIKQYPRLLQRLPKRVIAAYLGVSRETLSRFKPPKR